MLELATRLAEQGSPALGAAFRDESDNKILKAIGQHSHALVFHKRVLATHQLHLDGQEKRKRKATEDR